MEITWLGHSTFRLKGRDVAIVTDPHSGDPSGLPVPSVNADIVTVSHDHPNHSAVSNVQGKPRVLRGPGEYEIGGAMVWGVNTQRRTEFEGGPPGRNTAYLIQLEDVAVCHLGDLGGPLTPDQLAVLKDAQVLFIPVGGRCTISGKEAAEVVAQIEPRVVVPMHYAVAGAVGQDLEAVDRFCKEMGATDLTPQAKLNVSASSLPEEPTVVLLEPRR